MSDVLSQMIDEADQQVEDLTNTLSQLQTQIDEVQSQYNAVRNDMLDVIVTDTSSYLEIKMVEVGGSEIYYPTNFGESSISTFKILDATANIVYEYLGIGWDDDEVIEDYITKFNWGYDYLTKEMNASGTYGLLPKLNQLNSAKTLLTANKTKVTESKTYFADYA